MADEKKIQDPTVEFILRTAGAEPEAELRAFVGEMLGHSAEVGGPTPVEAQGPAGVIPTDGNPTIDAIMDVLKTHGGDIAMAAAPLVGAGIAGKGGRLKGAGIGAGVGLAGLGAAKALNAPGFELGLNVLTQLTNAMTRSKAPKDSKEFSGESTAADKAYVAANIGKPLPGHSNNQPGD